LLGLVQSAGGAIGAKVTADHIAIVDVGLDGTVHRASDHPFDPDSPTALDQLARLLKDAVAHHSGNLLGIGVGVPGGVDSQDSGIVEAPTLGWMDARVGPMLRSALGVPVLVENDVNTLAVAERLYGSMRDHLTYLVVTIGRGVGCGIVIDGSVYRGASGGAGEIGHIPVSADGPACGCGGRGCLEAHVGEDALVRTARERGVIGVEQTVADLRDAADGGDAVARAIYRDAGTLLGRVLAGVVHTLDPEVVVFSGEGIDAWEHWSPGFEASFRARLMPSRRHMPFVIEPWADDKWALGAAALVLATPFDAAGAAGDQGRLVRQRLHAGGTLS
jgi:predicted NBD/HSP70 family sugar kinase